MLIKVVNEAYYPRYVGWFVTVIKDQADAWESGKQIPSALMQLKPDPSQTKELTYAGDLWVFLPSNEFGVVSP